MMKSLILLVCCLVLVNGALVKQSVSTGDCVCATTNVHGRDKGSVSGSIITTISSGNCGKIYGGIVTADGYTWYEITYNSQRMWVAGNYLTASEASRCDTSVTASGGCPAIISRSQWGARSPKSRSYLQNPVQYLFIHHAESGDCHDQASCASLVRGFQNFHMDTRGWSDIAYTFLVGGDGSVFEGRGWDRVGAHTKGYNSVGYGAGGELLKTDIRGSDCVCADETTEARDKGGLAATPVSTILSGNCGKIFGGILTKDGIVWFEIKFLGQRVWIPGTNFTKQEAARCDAPLRTTSKPVTGDMCPHVIKRSQWGARAPNSKSYLSNPVQYAFIHHSDSNECHDMSSCASLVRGFQNFHMNTRGWPDIGFSFLVGGDGSVFEGRGWDRIGSHTLGYNSVGYGICLIGNFTSKPPTDIQVQKVQDLIECGAINGKFEQDYILRGHKDMQHRPTDCPGDVLYSMIRNWTHY